MAFEGSLTLERRSLGLGEATLEQRRTTPREEGFASPLGGSLSLGEVTPEQRKTMPRERRVRQPLRKFVEP